MLGEMDAKSPIVASISEIAHVLTGRSEIKPRKKASFGNLLGKLKLKKK
jgi:pilus assembly protein CpaE